MQQVNIHQWSTYIMLRDSVRQQVLIHVCEQRPHNKVTVTQRDD